MRPNTQKLTTAFTIGAGIVLFVFSLLLSSPAMAFMGLGLIIWGTSLIFVTSTRMIKASLIASQMSNLTVSLENLLKSLGYDGKSYVLPPRLPGENPVQIIESKNPKNPKFSIVPTGLHLVSLFEKEAGTDFLSIDLDQLQELLVKVIVDRLEMASEFKMLDEEGLVHIKLENFVFNDFYEYMHRTTSQDYIRLPCPTISALACVLAKATQKTVSIQKINFSENNLDVWFRFMQEEEK